MRILTRYVLWEVLKVFLVSLSVLTLMFILIGLVQEARKQGLEPQHVIRLLPFILPDALRYTVPATALFAACSVYGRMAGSNEVVALKSLGISPWAVLWPTLVFALVLSLGTVWLNDVAVSWGRAGVRRVVMESVEEIAYGMLRTQKSYASKNFSIIVKQVDGRRLVQPTISFFGQGRSRAFTLTAVEAELRSNLDAQVLTILCRDGTVDIEGQGRLRFHDTIEREIPLDQAHEAGEAGTTASDLPLGAIPGEIERQQGELRHREQLAAAGLAWQMLSGDLAALGGAEWQQESNLIEFHRNYVARLHTEPHRRWSNGFSCLCFVLVGSATAIRLRNADFLKSFSICFLPILVIYYPLLAFGVDLAKSGTLPSWSVWLGNVVFLVGALYQFRNIFRY